MWHTLIFTGALGRDPELRFTPEGKAVTSMNVAVSDGFGDKKKTIWFRVSVWDKQAESCNEYLRKGSKVLVEGRLTVDPATGGPRVFTRQDGTTGARFEVSASMVRFLSGKDEPEPGSLAADRYEQDAVPF